MRRTSSILALFSLVLSSTASVLYDANFDGLPLTRRWVGHSLHRRADSSCYRVGATCENCFGSGFIECEDGVNCYKPNDPVYGSCTGGSGSTGGGSGGGSSRASPRASPTTSASSTTSTISTGGNGIPDFCYQRGANCVSCFGSGYVVCPNAPSNCYNPGDSTTCCPGQCRGGSRTIEVPVAVAGDAASGDSAEASAASPDLQPFSVPASLGTAGAADAAAAASSTATYPAAAEGTVEGTTESTAESTVERTAESATEIATTSSAAATDEALASTATTASISATSTSTRTTSSRSGTSPTSAAGPTTTVATFTGGATSADPQHAFYVSIGALVAAAMVRFIGML